MAGDSFARGVELGIGFVNNIRDQAERTRLLMQDQAHQRDASIGWQQVQQQLMGLRASEQALEIEYAEKVREAEEKGDLKPEDVLGIMRASQPLLGAQTERHKREADVIMQWVASNPGNQYVEKQAQTFMQQSAEEINRKIDGFQNLQRGLTDMTRLAMSAEEGERDRALRERIAKLEIGARAGKGDKKLVHDLQMMWGETVQMQGLEDPARRREYAKNNFGIDRDVPLEVLSEMWLEQRMKFGQGVDAAQAGQPQPAPAQPQAPQQPAKPIGQRFGEGLRDPVGSAKAAGRFVEPAVQATAGTAGRFLQDVQSGFTGGASDRYAAMEPKLQDAAKIIDSEMKQTPGIPKRFHVRSAMRLRKVLRMIDMEPEEFLQMELSDQVEAVRQGVELAGGSL